MSANYNQRIIYPVLFILIPCILGIIGMVSNNVSIAIWIQNPLIILLATFGCMFVLTLKSWFSLDTLQPVNYTEGVLTMLHDLSVVLYIIGIAALFWIPIYFLISCIKENRDICMGITMYYWLMILSTFIGNFPVPFMGYGISPIYWGFIFFLYGLLMELTI